MESWCLYHIFGRHSNTYYRGHVMSLLSSSSSAAKSSRPSTPNSHVGDSAASAIKCYVHHQICIVHLGFGWMSQQLNDSWPSCWHPKQKPPAWRNCLVQELPDESGALAASFLLLKVLCIVTTVNQLARFQCARFLSNKKTWFLLHFCLENPNGSWDLKADATGFYGITKFQATQLKRYLFDHLISNFHQVFADRTQIAGPTNRSKIQIQVKSICHIKSPRFSSTLTKYTI